MKVRLEVLTAGASALGIHLSAAQMERFRRYYRELIEGNSRVNLTSVTGWEEVQSRHFLDSLTVSLAIPQDLLESGRMLDVGSGSGFPSLPIKIAFPGLEVTLIDSTAKKTAFLVQLKNALGLPDVEVRTGRAETLAHDPALRESFDLVVARAVAGMAGLAELTVPFCRVGGTVIAQKALGSEDEIARAQKSIDTMGARVKEVREVAVGYHGEVRSLVVLEKVQPTPERYPRRPGIPKKRPL